MKYHFIGIGGVGMSGLAEMLKEQGYQISGTNEIENDHTARLIKKGFDVQIGHSRDVVEDADIVIYSTAIPVDNPEIIASKEHNIPLIRRGEMLAKVVNEGEVIAIAGSHGKTSTTSVTGWVLDSLSPNVIVGGVVDRWNSNYKKGDSDIYVVEADESDNSFLHLNSTYSIVTNVDDDHLDFHGDFDTLKDSFTKFIGKSKVSIVNKDCQFLKDMNATAFYSIKEEADIFATNISYGGNSSKFNVTCKGKDLGKFVLAVTGEHFVSNALPVIFIALEKGLSVDVIKESLASVKIAKRRLETIFDKGIKIIDDCAHHPTEIIASIKSAKLYNPKRLVAIFQPHRHSRVKRLLDKFAESLRGVDKLHFLPIFDRLKGDVKTDDIFNLLVDKENAKVSKRDEVIDELMGDVREGDVYLFIGLGDVHREAYQLANLLDEHL